MHRAPALHRPADSSSATTSDSRAALDPQLRAAGVMGRIIDFFDALEACPDDALERVRGRLVDELANGRSGGVMAPHDSRRRSAVLTAALACVHAATAEGRRTGSAGASPEAPSLWGPRAGGPVTAGEVMHRIHRVLDGVTALQDPADSGRRPRGVDVLAYLLRGPEPMTWTRDQQDFGRCALEWMKGGVADPASPSAPGRGRWSTRAQRTGGIRSGHGRPKGIVLSA